MAEVVIIGMGFGGLRAAQTLKGQADIHVTVIDRNNYHLFQPLLYQVATATLEQESIAYPVRAITRRWDNVDFLMGTVTGIDLDEQQITVDTLPLGEDVLSYDYLIVAAGAVTDFYGNDSLASHAYDLKELDDSVRLRNHILRAFEQAAAEADEATRRALLTFVVVGGGPTGVEFAGSLSELVYGVLVDDYAPGLIEQTRILLVEGSDRLLPGYPEPLHRYTHRRLEKIGVEVQTGTRVSEATPTAAIMKDGSQLPTHTLIWSAGVRAVPLARLLSDDLDRRGRVPVTSGLSLPEYENVFVIGDMAYFEQDDEPLPMVAPVAQQQGKHAAQGILNRQDGLPTKPFHYVDRGRMAYIGRGAAVARTFGVNWTGILAWVAWLGLHIAMLIGFRNRLLVLLNWAYDYFHIRPEGEADHGSTGIR